MSYFNQVSIADGRNMDAFGRLRVSNPTNVFDCQFTYDLQPLQFEQITNGSGATVTYDSTGRAALMTFSSTPTGGKSYMQSYLWNRYQPGKSQLARITFIFGTGVANVLRFAGLSDGTNGYEFRQSGSTLQVAILSGTTNGNQTVTQSSWNLDKLDGTGASGYTLDITKAQQLVIDYEALYVGRVRFGFDIGGQVIYCHQFLFANIIASSYIQNASLPVRVGMTCTGTVSATMNMFCSSVSSEGGSEDIAGYEFGQEGTVTASSGAQTHLLSIRPKTTFNGITNRTCIVFLEVDVIATGNNPILWELVIGQAITGTTTFNDVNTTYSTTQYNTAGTISGSPTITIDNGYVSSSNQSKGADTAGLTQKYPITLDASGAVRSLGTISLLVTGIGGTSTCRGSLKWAELR